MLDYYEILGVSRTASEIEIKTAFRKLAKIHHPDIDLEAAGIDNSTKFREIAEAYRILSSTEYRELYDRGALIKHFTIQVKKYSFTFTTLAASGDISDIYKGKDVALKVVRDPRNNDLLENEARILKELFPIEQEEVKHFRYLPKYLGMIKLSEGKQARQANLFNWLTNFHSLVSIRESFSSNLPMEHGVWMLNRILEGLTYIHSKNIIHGALTPDHILVYGGGQKDDPWNHGAKLIDWSYAVKKGESVKAISPSWKHMYPPEILSKKPASFSTDIYMAVKSIIYVLGGDPSIDSLPVNIPSYLTRFLKGCTLKNQSARPQDVRELYDEFKTHMRSHYGPKKYVRFDLPTIS